MNNKRREYLVRKEKGRREWPGLKEALEVVLGGKECVQEFPEDYDEVDHALRPWPADTQIVTRRFAGDWPSVQRILKLIAEKSGPAEGIRVALYNYLACGWITVPEADLEDAAPLLAEFDRDGVVVRTNRSCLVFEVIDEPIRGGGGSATTPSLSSTGLRRFRQYELRLAGDFVHFFKAGFDE